MADGINRVTLIGNLGQDPVYRVTSNNRAVAEFSLATTESWKGEDGARHSHTEWHKIVVWGPAANAVRDHLHKGSKAYVEGSIRIKKWVDKEGKDRYTTEIQSSRVLFLSPPANAASHTGDGDAGDHDYGSGDTGNPDDDVPF